MDNKCGTCTACCKVYAIPDFDKPAGKWCDHCDVGKGCRIYAERPKRCVAFECMWLQSQSIPGREMIPELRPDRCKVVFAPSTNDKVMTAITMPGYPRAYERKNVRALIDRLVKAGVAVDVGAPASTSHLLFKANGIVTPITMTPPDKDGMQWSVNYVN